MAESEGILHGTNRQRGGMKKYVCRSSGRDKGAILFFDDDAPPR